MDNQELDTHQKALQLNLDSSVYGTIAEIGAGQEVANWLFRVGGASGSVAKTMSAYDMKISDDIYGRNERYVSRGRVTAMLDHEHGLLLERLDRLRGDNTRFFALANSVSARNYHGTNITHGWIGIRYQSTPRGETSDIFIHVNMRDRTNLLQQDALGVLGINLLYAVYNLVDSPDIFLKSLHDGLSISRIEIDSVVITGPLFRDFKQLELNLKLLKHGLARAVTISEEGLPIAPIDFLYKRPLVIERGSFQSIEQVHLEILERGVDEMLKEQSEGQREPKGFPEITIRDLSLRDSVAEEAFLKRVQMLVDLSKGVMISSFPQTYRLTSFINRYTSQEVRFVFGVASLFQILDESYYSDLDGGLLEAMGRLLAANVKLLIFGMDRETLKTHLKDSPVNFEGWSIPESGLVTLENIIPLDRRKHLYAYLLDTGDFVNMDS